MLFESFIKRHPRIAAAIIVLAFLIWTLPIGISQAWSAWVKDKTIPQWLGERRWPFLTTELYNWLVGIGFLVALALLGLIFYSTRKRRMPIASELRGTALRVENEGPLDDLLIHVRASEVQSQWAKLTSEQQSLLGRILIADGLNWDQIDDTYWKKLPVHIDPTVTDYLLERSTLLERKGKGNASLVSYVAAKKMGVRDQNLGIRTWKVKPEFRDALEAVIRRSGTVETTAPLPSIQQTETIHAPNLVCLGNDAVHVGLDRHEIFRQTEYSAIGMEAVTVEFRNEANPPQAIGLARNVSARILLYGFVEPEELVQEVDYACWLDQESPFASFDINQRHRLVIGTFQLKHGGGYSDSFTVYGNSPNSQLKLSRYHYDGCEGFRIVVRLNAGEHGEFGREDEFELRIQRGENHSVIYLTEARKRERREGIIRGLQNSLEWAERLFKGSITDVERFLKDVRAWQSGADYLITQYLGSHKLRQFHGITALMSSPLRISPPGIQALVDEFYTRFQNLKVIAADYQSAKDIREGQTIARRSYLADDFGVDGPVWRWRYGDQLGDLTPVYLTPYCPRSQCNRHLVIGDSDEFHSVTMHCPIHRNKTFGELRNNDATDFPAIRLQIKRVLEDGRWRSAVGRF